MGRRNTVRLFLLILAATSTVQSDYPPPSELGHDYYTSMRRSPGLVGTGRVTAGFGGGTYGSASAVGDWSSAEWETIGVVGGGGGGAGVGVGSILGGLNSAKCVDIPSNLTLCRNIGYDQMRLPNLLDHDTLKEVGQQASSWTRLLIARCHPDTQVFLCSLFAPVCLDRPVWPCRSLCEAVKIGCEDRMLKYGFPWPEMLRCDQYPADTELCIGLRGGDGGSCGVCSPTQKYETMMDSFCKADFALRIKINQSIVTGSDVKIVTAKKWKVYKMASTLKKREMRSEPLYIEYGASCNCAELEHTQQINGSSGQQQQQPKQAGRRSANFLVTGRKVNNRLVIDLLQPLEESSKDINRVMRAIRQRDICQTHQSTSPPKRRTETVITQGRSSSGSGGGARNSGKRKPSAGRNAEKRTRTVPSTITTAVITTTTTTTTTVPTTTERVKVRQGGGVTRNPSQEGGRRKTSRTEARPPRPTRRSRPRGKTTELDEASSL